MTRFQTLRASLQAEYARLISQPTLAGVLSDQARREMETALSPNASAAQIHSALTLLAKEGENRRAAFDEELTAMRQRIGGGPATKQTLGSTSGRTPVKRERNTTTGQIRTTYSDGSVEVQ